MSLTVIDKPKVDIDPAIRQELLTQVHEMGQVVLHFLFSAPMFGSLIRVWPTCYLYDQHSTHRSELIHHHNISLFPVWTEVMPLEDHAFTLVFTGLPKSCTVFDFIEDCASEGNEFKALNIQRNNTDVYFLRMS